MAAVAEFLAELRHAGFRGDLHDDPASCIVYATDNSIYQVPPRAVVCPRDQHDTVLALQQLAAHPQLALASRGGGTSTNGQCLTDGVVLDHLRHQHRLIELDPVARTATVEPGVVLDELNRAAAAHGLRFGPSLSTASRASLGGMVSTDAAGKGSRRLGKTSGSVIALDAVLADGSAFTARRLSAAEVTAVLARGDRIAELYRAVLTALATADSALADHWPHLPRAFAGYNLTDVRSDDGSVNLCPLLCGAEGSLAVITRITLRLVPKPAAVHLVILRSADLPSAVAQAGELLARDPEAIETIDGTVAACAVGTPVWQRVEGLLPGGEGPLTFVQFTGDNDTIVARAAAGLGGVHVTDAADIAAVWELRAAGVGVLGRLPGRRTPVPFIEDTLVPPQALPHYVRELTALLDAEGLRYGVFGHMDVGCLHVRPALDLTDPDDALRIRRISDAVQELVLRHGGVLWGEHGKGFRSEYLAPTLGAELHTALRRIKAAFDPENRLNPGKIAVPMACTMEVPRIDGVPRRADHDRLLTPEVRAAWQGAASCNGNGACHAPDPHQVMCPTWKLTRDRRQSPKGRSDVLRAWLAESDPQQIARLPRDDRPGQGVVDPQGLMHHVHQVLDGCVACHGCTGQCPVNVPIPELKSRFLAHWHAQVPRPLAHWAIASLETVAPWLARMPNIANRLLALLPSPGLVDLPRFSDPPLRRRMGRLGVPLAEAEVVLVSDALTWSFDAAVPAAAMRTLCGLGFRVHAAPPIISGKPQHILGLRHSWMRRRRVLATTLTKLAANGRILVALEPAVALYLRQECADQAMPQVALLGSWLAQRLREHRMPKALPPSPGGAFRLLAHCTESATAASEAIAWIGVFRAASARLQVETLTCCGMAGAWGHQHDHASASRALFGQTWAPAIAAAVAADSEPLADGFSCRSQSHRCGGPALRHPIQALADLLDRSQSE